MAHYANMQAPVVTPIVEKKFLGNSFTSAFCAVLSSDMDGRTFLLGVCLNLGIMLAPMEFKG